MDTGHVSLARTVSYLVSREVPCILVGCLVVGLTCDCSGGRIPVVLGSPSLNDH